VVRKVQEINFKDFTCLWERLHRLYKMSIFAPGASSVQATKQPRRYQSITAPLWESRSLKGEGGVMMAVLAAYIVMLSRVYLIGLADCPVPIPVHRRGYYRVPPNRSHHEIVDTNTVRARKVVDTTLTVCNAHVTNTRAAAGQWAERTPNNCMRIALAVDVNLCFTIVRNGIVMKHGARSKRAPLHTGHRHGKSQ